MCLLAGIAGAQHVSWAEPSLEIHPEQIFEPAIPVSDVEERFMKIALIGASGNAGSRILQELSDRGHAVTAIARDPSKSRLAGRDPGRRRCQ